MNYKNLLLTKTDQKLKDEVESCTFAVDNFDHRTHLRLAYIYLVQNKSTTTSVRIMKETLIRLLIRAGVDPSIKYHQTLTEAWILAVNHFMNKTTEAKSTDDFIDQHPQMLDSKIMLTHYSAEVLFSDEARQNFVQPNLDPIP